MAVKYPYGRGITRDGVPAMYRWTTAEENGSYQLLYADAAALLTESDEKGRTVRRLDVRWRRVLEVRWVTAPQYQVERRRPERF